jgi:hypothetical protein
MNRLGVRTWISMSKLTERAELLRTRFREGGHRADCRLEHEVRGATPNADRIRDHLEHYLSSVDNDGLRLMTDLEAAGNVEITTTTGEMVTFGASGRIHKGAFIPEASLPSLLAPAHLGEAEDLHVLRPLRSRVCPEVVGQLEIAEALDGALARLAARHTPATHIVLPWNWELAQWLLERGGEMNLKTRYEMGTYHGVRVFRGPSPWPSQLVMVFALQHWIRIRLGAPPAAASQLHRRFRSEVRPPTPEEAEETRNGPPLESSEGLPFQGDDLEAAIANQWLLFVLESLAVDEVDPEAMACYLYRPHA